MTLQAWYDHLYAALDAYGNYVLVVAYFAFIIFTGSFFFMNLSLAVVYEEYVKSHDRVKLEEIARKKVHSLHGSKDSDSDSSSGSDSDDEDGAGGRGHGQSSSKYRMGTIEEGEDERAGEGKGDDEKGQQGQEGSGKKQKLKKKSQVTEVKESAVSLSWTTHGFVAPNS